MNRSELRVKKLGFWGDKRLALTNRNLHDSNLDRYVLWRQDQPWSLSVHGVVCVLFFLVVSYLSHHVFESNLLAGGSALLRLFGWWFHSLIMSVTLWFLLLVIVDSPRITINTIYQRTRRSINLCLRFLFSVWINPMFVHNLVARLRSEICLYLSTILRMLSSMANYKGKESSLMIMNRSTAWSSGW